MRVLLVDDHHLFREGLALLLGNHAQIELAGGASTAREACALVDKLAPDVVILDMTLPDSDGIATTREILRRRPRTHVPITAGWPSRRRRWASTRSTTRTTC